jgi:ATP synthase protein I
MPKGSAVSVGASRPLPYFNPLVRGSASIVADDPDTAQVKEDPAIGSLEGRIAAARKAEDERSGHRRAQVDAARGTAANMASTMIGYPLGGAIMGWVLDNVFDTLPWLTIGVMFFAFFCACVQVLRTLNAPAAGLDAQQDQE